MLHDTVIVFVQSRRHAATTRQCVQVRGAENPCGAEASFRGANGEIRACRVQLGERGEQRVLFRWRPGV